MLDAGRYHIVIRPPVLKDEPHALHIILGVPPVAQRREVAKVQFLLLPLTDPRGREGDLPRDERLAAPLALVVEQDAVAAEHVVGVAVLSDDPVAVLLGDGIRTVGMERGVLVLRHLLNLSIEF